MAKAIKVKVKLESSAGTGTFYLAEKNFLNLQNPFTLKKNKCIIDKKLILV